MADISKLSKTDKAEIASYLKEDNLDWVNSLIEPARVKDSFYTRYGKRALDLLIGASGFVISAPINIVLAFATYADVGSPIIFKQKRKGRGEKDFTLYKFRNMTNETDSNGELLPASERVTKWGKFVRRTSLDELLNFVSVVKGDMSIIGPRPLLDRYAERLNNRHKAIYQVRPGLECPTPKRVNHELSFQERLDNYVWYVENCSFLVDLKLCLRMLEITVDRKSTASRASAGHGGIIGYDKNNHVIGLYNVPEEYVKKFCDNHGYANLDEAIKARNN